MLDKSVSFWNTLTHFTIKNKQKHIVFHQKTHALSLFLTQNEAKKAFLEPF
jgi:hypothetical protein